MVRRGRVMELNHEKLGGYYPRPTRISSSLCCGGENRVSWGDHHFWGWGWRWEMDGVEGTILKEWKILPRARERVFTSPQPYCSCPSLSKLTFIHSCVLYFNKHHLSPYKCQTVAPVLTWIRSLRSPPAPPMGTGRGGRSVCRRHANPNYLPSPHVTFFRSTLLVWEQNSPADYLRNASFPWQEMTDKVPQDKLKIFI